MRVERARAARPRSGSVPTAPPTSIAWCGVQPEPSATWSRSTTSGSSAGMSRGLEPGRRAVRRNPTPTRPTGPPTAPRMALASTDIRARGPNRACTCAPPRRDATSGNATQRSPGQRQQDRRDHVDRRSNARIHSAAPRLERESENEADAPDAAVERDADRARIGRAREREVADRRRADHERRRPRLRRQRARFARRGVSGPQRRGEPFERAGRRAAERRRRPTARRRRRRRPAAGAHAASSPARRSSPIPSSMRVATRREIRSERAVGATRTIDSRRDRLGRPCHPARSSAAIRSKAAGSAAATRSSARPDAIAQADRSRHESRRPRPAPTSAGLTDAASIAVTRPRPATPRTASIGARARSAARGERAGHARRPSRPGSVRRRPDRRRAGALARPGAASRPSRAPRRAPAPDDADARVDDHDADAGVGRQIRPPGGVGSAYPPPRARRRDAANSGRTSADAPRLRHLGDRDHLARPACGSATPGRRVDRRAQLLADRVVRAGPTPPNSASVVRRRSASTGPFACTVESEPS